MADQKQYTDMEIMAAYADAFCQLLAIAMVKIQGIGSLLAQKQYATGEELDAFTTAIPQDSFNRLVTELRQQMQHKVNETLRNSSGKGLVH